MGQLALGIAGAAAGNFILPGIGGQIGFAIGSYAGAQLFSEDIENRGPRIDDAAVTTSAYGQLLPIVWGVYPVAGNIIDSSAVRTIEIEEDVGGKGGPTQTNVTYEYYGDLDVAICQGPIDAVLQIRMNGKIIFNAAPDATVVKPSWLNFTLYTGAEDQPVDPTFEAINGVGSTSAYRGTAHIVFSNFPFAQSGNNFTPTFEFLVAVDASSGLTLQSTAVSIGAETSTYAGGVIEPSTGLLIFPIQSNSSTYSIAAVDPYTRQVVWRTPYDQYRAFRHPLLIPRIDSLPTGDFAVPGELYFFVTDPSVANYIARVDAASGAILDYSDAVTTGTANLVGGAVDWTDGINPLATLFVIKNRGSFNGHDLLKGYPSTTAILPPDGWYIGGGGIVSNGAGLLLVQVADAEISPTNVGVAVLETADLIWSSVLVTGGFSAAVWAGNSWWIKTGNDELKEISTTPTVIQTIDLSVDYSITDIILDGSSTNEIDGLVYDENANDLLFQSATTLYRLDLDDTTQTPETILISGTTLTLYHPETCRAWYGQQNSINAKSANLCAATGASATLDVVTSDLSINGTSLTASDIDVTDLAGVTVRGFAISTAMARRNAIAMLQTAYLYDYVPRSGKLTGILRGDTPSVTLTQDEIGAYIDGGSPPPPWTITRAAASSLPDQVEITFVDPDHNYEAGTQLARRQASDVGTTSRITLAISLTNDEAAQIAETYIHLLHIEAEKYKTTTMPSTIDDVQPAEVLQTTYDGVDYVYRVISGSIIDGRMIEMLGAREVPEVFVNYAVGGDPRGTNSDVAAIGLTILRPLDIPMLRAQDDNAGVYVAGASYTPGWPGADVQRSTDGVSYSSVAALTSQATMGNALNVPSTGTAGKIDTASTLNLALIYGSLSSTSRAAPTYAAWGVNGRLEVIGFITASQNADGYWQVSDIMRGLLDTGHAVESHAIGDQFVVLNTATLKRVIYSSSSIDQIEFLRGVSFGRTSASAISTRYTFTAESLEPYAPCRLHGEIDGSSNWDLSWSRQDRTLARPLWSPANTESTETYSLEILDETDAVVRTETVTDATTFEYTTTMQSDDFGENQEYLRWRVYQVSANTGNGHVASAESGSAYNYPGATVDKSPVLYAKFSETTGTTAFSTVGTIDGLYTGGFTLAQTPLLPTGKAVTLDGTNGMIQFLPYGFSGSWMNCLEISFNITNFAASGEDALISHRRTDNNFQTFTLSVHSDQKLYLKAWRTGGTQVINLSGATLSTGTDYHLIINWGFSGSDPVVMYLNNSTYASGTVSNDWGLDTTSGIVRLRIGGQPSASYGYFDGKIDDVVFYPDNLTSDERADQFIRGGIA